MHNVSALVAPVADDALAAELHLDDLLELMVAVGPLFKLSNLLKTRRGRHELEDAVDRQSAAQLGLEGRRLEAWHDHQTLAGEVNWGVDIEETRRPTNLLQIGLSEGLVDYQVEHRLLDVVIFVRELVVEVDGFSGLHGDLDMDVVTSEIDFPVDRFADLVESEHRLASGDEGANRSLDLLPFHAEDLKHFVSLPELIWTHFKAVLVDHQVVGQAQLVQI